MSADVQLDKVSVRFGDFVAVRDANITIKAGEFFSFLGPSGCGKTTLLRVVSGFQETSEGTISIGGQDMAGIGANKRPTALIFQNLALFPLMKVWENIAFGLEVRGIPKTERRRRAEELLDLIALSGQGDKLVSELSGGQRQRVAIARALAVEPQVLLLDEPLSALDLKLRQHMRTELRAIQKRVGITFIYITHDQGEALTMSDRVAVMREGVIEQVSDSTTIYNHPETAFVASFVGENNAFKGTLVTRDGDAVTLDTEIGPMRARLPGGAAQALKPGDAVLAFIRPESLKRLEPGEDADTRMTTRLLQEEFEGTVRHLVLQAGEDKTIKMSLMNDGRQTEVGRDGTVEVGCRADLVVALPPGPLAKEL